MTRRLIATVVLAGTLLASGCGGDPTCDDVDSLTARLERMEPDDPDYNTVVNELAQAAADCNR